MEIGMLNFLSAIIGHCTDRRISLQYALPFGALCCRANKTQIFAQKQMQSNGFWIGLNYLIFNDNIILLIYFLRSKETKVGWQPFTSMKVEYKQNLTFCYKSSPSSNGTRNYLKSHQNINIGMYIFSTKKISQVIFNFVTK